MTQPFTPDPANARAEAAAAKAYAKAQRNWFARHKILTGIGVLIVIGGIGSAAGGNSSSKNPNAVGKTSSVAVSAASPAAPAASPAAPAASPAAAKSTSPAPAVSKAPAGLADKDFTSAKPILKDEYDEFSGTAKITNTSDTSKTATFTYTLYKAGQQVGTLQGSVNDLAAGHANTVDLISQDKYVTGVDKIEFQVDAEF